MQLLTSILIARVVGFEGAGVNSLGLTLANVFYPVALYGVRGFQVSDIRDQYPASSYTFLRLVTTAAAVVLSALLLACLELSTSVVLCAVAYTVCRVLESFSDLFFAFFQKRDRFDIIFVSNVLKSVAMAGAILVALQFTSSIPLITAALAAAFGLVFLVYDLPKAGPLTVGVPDAALLTVLLRKCFPLMAFGFITPYINFVVRYFVEMLHGTEIQGYYSAIAILHAVMVTLAGSIWVVYLPLFALLHREGDVALFARTLLRILLWVLGLAVAAIAATVLLGDLVLRLVYGPGILPFSHLLLPVVLISAVSCVVMLLNTVLIAIGRNSVMLLANAGGAIAITAVAYPLIQFFGVSGANGAMLAGVVLQTILLAVPVIGALKTRPSAAGPA